MTLRKTHRLRLVFLGLVFVFLSSVVVARLYHLQVVDHERFEKRASGQQLKTMVIHPSRGTILDRRGEPVAQSTARHTLYINSNLFSEDRFGDDYEVLKADVAKLLDVEVEELTEKLSGSGTTLLGKRLTTDVAKEIQGTFKEYGVRSNSYWFDRESLRIYPKALASSILGFCRREVEGDIDGLAGLELYYNDYLRGTKVETQAPVSGLLTSEHEKQFLEPLKEDEALQAQGHQMKLTLDMALQEDVEKIIARTVQEFEGDTGGAVVMDPNSGGIYALATYPTFDNNKFGSFPAAHRRNRAVTDPFETGSVIKLFTAAILIDLGLITPDTLIDCEDGYAVVDRRILRDSPGHYLGVATFREALRWSSNIGLVKAAQVLENEQWYEYLTAFSFGQKTGIDLPGEAGGILRPPHRWDRYSRTSLPMGYEMSVTPVQAAAAVSALVNGGVYYTPHVVSEIRDQKGQIVMKRSDEPVRRVIRPTTSEVVTMMMEDIVLNGTGDEAALEGYRVGGKTGTTRKSSVFDHREYISSFAGCLPVNNPQLVIYVYVDNPKTAYYASKVVAPAFAQIAQASVLHLGIAPMTRTEQQAHTEVALQKSEANQSLTERSILGRMPDYTGKSIREVRASLPKGVQSIKFQGTGVVTDQFPLAGDPVDQSTQVVLNFSHEVKQLEEVESEDDGTNSSFAEARISR